MPALLFVCTANRIRSPMAEVLMLRTLQESQTQAWRVESAGTWARAGRAAMPLAVGVAAEHGIDLSTHRSRAIDDIRLEEYALIMTMEAGQRDAMRAEFPAIQNSVFTLTEIVSGIAYDVDDPIGGDIQDYQATWSILERLIQEGRQAILEKAESLAG